MHTKSWSKQPVQELLEKVYCQSNEKNFSDETNRHLTNTIQRAQQVDWWDDATRGCWWWNLRQKMMVENSFLIIRDLKKNRRWCVAKNGEESAKSGLAVWAGLGVKSPRPSPPWWPLLPPVENKNRSKKPTIHAIWWKKGAWTLFDEKGGLLPLEKNNARRRASSSPLSVSSHIIIWHISSCSCPSPLRPLPIKATSWDDNQS